MRNFASTLVKFSKLSHIQTTIWRPPKMAPPRTAGSAGPFVTPLPLRQMGYMPQPCPNMTRKFGIFKFSQKVFTMVLNRKLLVS